MRMFGRALIIWRFLLCFTLLHLVTIGEALPQPESYVGAPVGLYGHYYGDSVHNGKKCDEKSKCKSEDGFVCIDGMCACQFSQHQYLGLDKKCLSMVHGPCISSKNISLPCTPNAKCMPDLQSYHHHKCVCADGYIESFKRTCDLAYGQACGKERSQLCDDIGGLACVEGTCKCRDDLQVYDEKEKRCKGIVGATCTFMENDYCVGGTSCKEVLRDSHRHGVTGMCKCDPGLKWDGKQCVK